MYQRFQACFVMAGYAIFGLVYPWFFIIPSGGEKGEPIAWDGMDQFLLFVAIAVFVSGAASAALYMKGLRVAHYFAVIPLVFLATVFPVGTILAGGSIYHLRKRELNEQLR